jgi:sugar porter (SP) family MFS transporter
MAAGVAFALGSAICALAPNIGTLIAGRVMVGVSIGLASLTVPLYIAEIAPTPARGKLVSLNQLALTSGIVIAYGVGYAFASIQGWREMFAVAIVPALALVVGMVALPESPRWLVSRGLVSQAQNVLRRLRATANVDAELHEISQSLRSQKGSWRELLGPVVRPAVVIGVTLAILQQITGINTVIYYAPTIVELAGLRTASAALLATTGVGLINVGFTVVAIALLDRLGRRPLLLAGLLGMTFSLALLGLLFWLPGMLGNSGGALFLVLALCLYVASFAIGMGPVFWLLIAEIYPLKVRGLAMGVATVANWGANLVVALTFLSLMAAIGRSFTFWFYAVVTAIGLVFAWYYVPETKGKTLEQIEAHWRAGRHPLDLGTPNLDRQP